MPIVLIPTPLRRFTRNSSKVLVAGKVVSEVVDNLVLDYPEVQSHLFDSTGSIRQFINIFVDEDDIRNLHQLNTTVNVDSTISIVPAIAGGNL
jgi:molybdopterin converting factor small subunit